MIWRGASLGHCFDRVLIAEIIRALHAVECVRFGRVVGRVAERGVDAALRRAGMTTDRMHFRDDGDVGPTFSGFNRCPHAGKSTADHDDVVFDHYLDAPY